VTAALQHRRIVAADAHAARGVRPRPGDARRQADNHRRVETVSPVGSAEDALDTACVLYLADAPLGPEPPTNLGA